MSRPCGTAALAGVAAGAAGELASAPVGAGGVHRPEAGGGEGGEDARVRGDGLRDALAAGQPGADDLPGVVLVDAGAGGAGVLAAVPAGDAQHAAGFAVGVVDDAGLAGGAVDGADPACEADRAGAVAGSGELGFPAVEVVAGGELEDGSGRCPRPQAGIGPGGERDGRDRHAVVISRTRESARCLSGSGRIRVRLSRVSQLRAVRTWSRYSPAAWTRP